MRIIQSGTNFCWNSSWKLGVSLSLFLSFDRVSRILARLPIYFFITKTRSTDISQLRGVESSPRFFLFIPPFLIFFWIFLDTCASSSLKKEFIFRRYKDPLLLSCNEVYGLKHAPLIGSHENDWRNQLARKTINSFLPLRDRREKSGIDAASSFFFTADRNFIIFSLQRLQRIIIGPKGYFVFITFFFLSFDLVASSVLFLSTSGLSENFITSVGRRL